MLKRFVYIVLAGALLLPVAACGTRRQDAPATEELQMQQAPAPSVQDTAGAASTQE